MNTNYTAVIKQDTGWWIGWIEEVHGVNCQEETRDALLESLRVTLREALEFNRSDAIEAAGHNYEELARVGRKSEAPSDECRASETLSAHSRG